MFAVVIMWASLIHIYTIHLYMSDTTPNRDKFREMTGMGTKYFLVFIVIDFVRIFFFAWTFYFFRIAKRALKVLKRSDEFGGEPFSESESVDRQPVSNRSNINRMGAIDQALKGNNMNINVDYPVTKCYNGKKLENGNNSGNNNVDNQIIRSCDNDLSLGHDDEHYSEFNIPSYHNYELKFPSY